MNNLTVADQLVLVFEAKIGDTVTQACDARILHAFLENGDKFADWIKARITKYQFQENQDFASFSAKTEKPTEGRPAKEYHLTLDMAKELAMVENNTKGREARRYFIAMEKRVIAHGLGAIPAPHDGGIPSIETRSAAAAMLKIELDVANLFTCPLHLAQVDAVKQVRATYGVDFSSHLLTAPAQQKVIDTDVMLEPTELGKLFGMGNATTQSGDDSAVQLSPIPPKKFAGWIIGYDRGFIKMHKRFPTGVRSIYIGKHWDAGKAAKKVYAIEGTTAVTQDPTSAVDSNLFSLA